MDRLNRESMISKKDFVYPSYCGISDLPIGVSSNNKL